MAKIVNLFKLCEYIRSLSFYFLNSMSKIKHFTALIQLFLPKKSLVFKFFVNLHP